MQRPVQICRQTVMTVSCAAQLYVLNHPPHRCLGLTPSSAQVLQRVRVPQARRFQIQRVAACLATFALKRSG